MSAEPTTAADLASERPEPADTPAAPGAGLTPAERQEAAAAFAAELMEEHERRVARANRAQQRSAARSARQDEAERTRELNDLKDEVRARFYAEKGYKRYYDSTGRELWLTPEEYALRMKRRKRRRRTFEPESMGRTRTVLFYLALLGVAVVMGFLLAR